MYQNIVKKCPKSSPVGIFCGNDIFWYFVHVNILNTYASMLNYNIDSKGIYEKKISSNKSFKISAS